MKITLATLILVILSVAVMAQEKTEKELMLLYNSNQSNKDIDQYASNPKDLSALSLYYVGELYLERENYENALKYLDLSIEKDTNVAISFYLKGETLYKMQKYEEAIKSYQAAIKLNPDREWYYNGLGQCYYAIKNYDLALKTFKASTEHCRPDCNDQEPYTMMGNIYSDMKDDDKALEAWYMAQSRAYKGLEEYSRALYNIWLLESKKGNNDKADSAYSKLISSNNPAPDCPVAECYDYYACSRVIQIYYHRKEYDKAKPFKDKMYEAHRRGFRFNNLTDMFCLDQFEWNDKVIQVFERFDEGSKNVYAKHIFVISNQSDDAGFKIQTEYSPISIEQGGSKYLLCMLKGDTHSTFNIGFNDNFKYDDLKDAVISILEGKVKPITTSKLGN